MSRRNIKGIEKGRMNLNIDLRTLALRICELFELQDVFALTTPEGRWQAFRKWQKDNPKWKNQIQYWIHATPDEAFNLLRDWIAKEAQVPLAIFKMIVASETEAQIKPLISHVQELFREREQMDVQKEIAG